MDTSPQLYSVNRESANNELSPNVLSPHIDASLLLRRRSSFQFKFLSKVNELRDAIRHAVTFEKSSPNAAVAAAGPTIHDNGRRRSSVTLKIDKAVEAFSYEKNKSCATKWTQTEEKYFEVSSFHRATPVSAPKKKKKKKKKKIPVGESPTNSEYSERRESRELADTTDGLAASFLALGDELGDEIGDEIEDGIEDGIGDEIGGGVANVKHMLIDEDKVYDSLRSFLENERRAVKEVSEDEEESIAGENDAVVVASGKKLSIDEFLSSSVINSTKESEEESHCADYSSNASEHIFEQSLKIYSPLCSKQQRSTSSPKFQDSGYDYFSTSLLSDEGKSLVDNSLDLKLDSLPKKRMMTVPEENVLNKTFQL